MSTSFERGFARLSHVCFTNLLYIGLCLTAVVITTTAMDDFQEIREDLRDLYSLLVAANPTDPLVIYHTVTYSFLVDEILRPSDIEEGDQHLPEMIGNDYFMLRQAPPNLVLREINTNRVDIDQPRRLRRSRRRAEGKENRRPRRQNRRRH